MRLDLLRRGVTIIADIDPSCIGAVREGTSLRTVSPAHGKFHALNLPTAHINQLNESPHAHELPAFGLSIVKPCFSMESAKSIVAPSR